jgi:hypothetical protein
MLIALELMLACMCRALQPPCPDPVMDDCVPLAVITVQNSDTCNVVSICNWTMLRTYVTTFPNLQYWLSIFPFGRMLREALENFCCNAIKQFEPQARESFNNDNRNVNAENVTETVYAKKTNMNASYVSMSDASPATAFQASAQTITRSRQFMQMALDTLSSSGTSMDAESLTLGLLGEKNADQQSYLTAEQSDNLMQFLVMDQLAKPALRTMMPKGLGGLSMFGNLAGMMSGVSASNAAPSTDYEARFKALDDTVQKQQTMIDQLTAQLKTHTVDKPTAKSTAKSATRTTKPSNAKKKNG